MMEEWNTGIVVNPINPTNSINSINSSNPFCRKTLQLVPILNFEGNN